MLSDDTRLTNKPTPTVGIIARTTMQQATIIPDYDLAYPPCIRQNILRSRCVGQQTIE